MRTIAYLSQVLVTDDHVAELVLEYARTLAVHNTSDTVVIPVVDKDGAVTSVELLIGPASQMMTGFSERDPIDLDAASTLAALRAKINKLEPEPLDSVDQERGDWDDTHFDA
jgi:hypothetical protein